MSSPSLYHLFGWYVDGGHEIVKGGKKNHPHPGRAAALAMHWQGLISQSSAVKV
jgi:hypothetical protein